MELNNNGIDMGGDFILQDTCYIYNRVGKRGINIL